MDFKEYYHKKLDEELQVQQSAAEASYASTTGGEYDANTLKTIVAKYVRDGDIKDGLKKLAADLGAAIYEYAINDYVNDEMFDSADSKTKYVNIITQKIQQGSCSTLHDLLKHCAIDIANARTTITM